VYIHLVVEHLRLAGLSLRDQAITQDSEDVPTDLLELLLDLVSVLLDLSNVLVGSLGFLFLFDGGDDPPRGPSCSHDILVGDGQKIAFVNSQLSPDLISVSMQNNLGFTTTTTYLSDLL